MGFRFRKSFKIAPGIRFNVSNKGFGMSAGMPGTGLSYSASTNTRKRKGTNADQVINYSELPTSVKSKKTTLLLCIFLGIFGIHRFYTGKIGTGVLWFVTVGIFFFGWLSDIIRILSGHFLDSNGCVIR